MLRESKDPFASPRITDTLKTYRERFTIDVLAKRLSFFGDYINRYGTKAPSLHRFYAWINLATSQEFATKAYDSIQMAIKESSLNSDNTAIYVLSTLTQLNSLYSDMIKKNHKGSTFENIEKILTEYQMPLDPKAYEEESNKIFHVIKLTRADLYARRFS